MTECSYASSIEAGHEPPTFDTRRVLLWVAALLGLIATAAVLMFALLSAFRSARPHGPSLSSLKGIESARTSLDSAQVLSRRHYEEQQRQLLTRYGWVDASQEVARIPIGRALQLYQQQHEPQE